ncbi:MAG: hypothetical protein PHQ02_09925 [Candidatus Riflebacteria bacterium]|nr:hypothetical protein [Candidatus Riflebacteria bacterium]
MENKIRSIVFSFLDMAKIPYKEIRKGVWVANIPETEKNFFGNVSLLEFTFQRDLAEEHRNVELVCEGSFLLRKIIERMSVLPRVSRVFSKRIPETPPQSLTVVTDSSYYRSKVVFNYKVTFHCEQNKDKLYSVVADTAFGVININDNLFEVDMNEFSETPDSNLKIEDSGYDILKLYMEACQRLEDEILTDIKDLRCRNEEKYNQSIKVFDDYLDEQKNELLKKKENVSFHLYFFQKEEEIDKMLANLEEERKRKTAELQDKYKVKVSVTLINAVVLCIPTIGAASSKAKRTISSKL